MPRLGIDIGGTFTDVTAIDERSGETFHWKTLTDPGEPVRAVMEALDRAAFSLEELTFLSIGSTIGINAVIERKGARTAILTTRGFRDILEVRRSARTHVLDPLMDKPYSFVPRRWRLEVGERVLWDGSVLEPLDEEELRQTLVRLIKEKVESVAICFLHSYANPVHERRAGEILSSQFPSLYHTLSSDIVPEIGEYERTSTAALNAYIHPVIHRHLARLEADLKERGLQVDIHVMQSNGGIMTGAEASHRPIHVLESGPAAGSIAGAYIARLVGIQDIVTLDMGGTTAKASVVEGGEPLTTLEFELFEEPNKPGSGWPIRVPMIDIVEVGAGGGTIGWLDDGGNLQVGPQSAGAAPGPVCYNLGGIEPTVTDANAVLGRLASLLDGALQLNAEKARRAIAEKVAGPLGLSVEEAAAGIQEINDTRASDLLREMTIARGRDPRDFTLVAFGGAGPLAAAYVMSQTGMAQALVPPVPGNFSALGLLLAELVHDGVRAYSSPLEAVDATRVNTLFKEMGSSLSAALGRQGIDQSNITLYPSADVRYKGQFHVINISLPFEPVTEASLMHVRAKFHGEHLRLFTYQLLEDPLEMVNLRLRAVGEVSRPSLRRIEPGDAQAALKGTRKVYFREEGRALPCSIYSRERLGSSSNIEGPAIVEEVTSTTLIPPGYAATIDDYGNILIRRAG